MLDAHGTESRPATRRRSVGGRNFLRLALAILLVGSPMLSANALEVVFDRQNCAITPPKGWHLPTGITPPPGMIGAAQSPDSRRIVMLMVRPGMGLKRPVDERFIANFDKGYAETSFETRVWGRIVEVWGIKSYERLGKKQVGGQTMTVLTLLIPADGKGYMITGLDASGDASTDREILGCIESFRFLRQPAGLPLPLVGNLSAYDLGVWVGRIMAIALFCLGAVVIGVWIFLLVRKPAPAPPTFPPPIPRDWR